MRRKLLFLFFYVYSFILICNLQATMVVEEKISEMNQQFVDLDLYPDFESHYEFNVFLQMISNLEFENEKIQNECMNQVVQHRIEMLKEQIEFENKIRINTRLENFQLEMDIINICNKIASMKEEVKKCKYERFMHEMDKDVDNSYLYDKDLFEKMNLIRAQLEMYFSDYHLRRDKKLLNQICQPPMGFLTLTQVKNLPHIQQLRPTKHEIYQALMDSKCLIGESHGLIGCINFKAPQLTRSPYYRNIFVYGLPSDCDDKYVLKMLEPFGKINKITFDCGYDSIDRLVSRQLFESFDKVYTLTNKGNGTFKYECNGLTNSNSNDNDDYVCHKCEKPRKHKKGYYYDSGSNNQDVVDQDNKMKILCLECAAKLADENVAICNQLNLENEMKEKYIGKKIRNSEQSKTCIATFSSQKHMKKCVYVRSRIGFDGCFCCNYCRYMQKKRKILKATIN